MAAMAAPPPVPLPPLHSTSPAESSIPQLLHYEEGMGERSLERHSSDVRQVERVLQTFFERRGLGEIVTHSIGRQEQQQLDPFLLFEDVTVFAPEEYPEHLHQGFESVSYVVKGSFQYEDFTGNGLELGRGSVQRMMSGSGMLHTMAPSTSERSQILRLWINLPEEMRMCPPQSQCWTAQQMHANPSSRGVTVKLVAGAAPRSAAAIPTPGCSPMTWLDVTVKPGGKFVQSLPSSWNAFAYVLEGAATTNTGEGSAMGFGPHAPKHTVIFKEGGRKVVLRNKGTEKCRFMFIAGQPSGKIEGQALRWDCKVLLEQEDVKLEPGESGEGSSDTEIPSSGQTGESHLYSPLGKHARTSSHLQVCKDVKRAKWLTEDW